MKGKYAIIKEFEKPRFALTLLEVNPASIEINWVGAEVSELDVVEFLVMNPCFHPGKLGGERLPPFLSGSN